MNKVLVVDDNKGIRTVIAHILSQEYEIIEACNGEEALDVLSVRGDDMSMVVLDIEMPVTNGWEALRIIRDEDGWPDLGVVMITGHKEPENVLKAWQLGADYYITKPFCAATLLDITYKIMNKEKVFD